MRNRHVHRQVGGRTGIFSEPYNRSLFVPLASDFGSAAKKGPENPISVVDGKPEGARERPMTDPSASVTRCPQAGEPEPGCPPDAGATVARTVEVRATVPPWCPPGGRPSARGRLSSPPRAGRT